MTVKVVSRARFVREVGTIGLPSETPLLLAQLKLYLSMDTVTEGRPGKHTHIHVYLLGLLTPADIYPTYARAFILQKFFNTFIYKYLEKNNIKQNHS